MDAVSRRRFLTLTGGAAVATAAVGVGWSTLASRAQTDPLAPGAGVLVVLTLYGGNDGINTVVPASDPAYQQARPELAYAEHEVLPLAEGLGLNPGMPGLKKHWDDGRLAIVRGASYPKPDHSHFRSMSIWQTASPETSVPTGWLGRWLDANGADPLLAVSLEPVLPPLLAGATTAGAALPVGGLQMPDGPLGKAFAALGGLAGGEPGPQAAAAKAIADLHREASTLGPALNGGGTKAAAGADHSALKDQLDVVAQCVEMGVPTRVYSVSLGGFDTHANERNTQQRLLTEVDTAMSGFLDRMAGSDRGHNVVLLAYSEFGRRVAANANQGTDHGTAGPVFVAGSRVHGGFIGAQPSLTDLDNGDLKPTTDFRDVYATVLADVLGSDPERVLGAGRQTLPIIAA